MRVALLLLMTVVILVSHGQSGVNSAANEKQKQVPLAFNQQEFGDRFSVLNSSDDSYDYYVIDLTKLGGNFERVYFMNLTYSDSRLINIDSDIQKDQTWFKVYFTYKEEEITCLFKDLKDKTLKAQSEMSTEEKSAWMAKYNKFKKVNNNE